MFNFSVRSAVFLCLKCIFALFQWVTSGSFKQGMAAKQLATFMFLGLTKESSKPWRAIQKIQHCLQRGTREDREIQGKNKVYLFVVITFSKKGNNYLKIADNS